MGYKIQRDENGNRVKVPLSDGEQARMARHLAPIFAAHEDAKKRGIGKGKGGTGECKCPNCDGTIRYAVASINGHMHACCSTPGCASWME